MRWYDARVMGLPSTRPASSGSDAALGEQAESTLITSKAPSSRVAGQCDFFVFGCWVILKASQSRSRLEVPIYSGLARNCHLNDGSISPRNRQRDPSKTGR